ncbi:MAG: twitching motility protein PilT [Rhizobacter sp.]|nr:twitching motility protein PilT [Rhizobacter sp.]
MQAGVEVTRDQDTAKADELERWVNNVCAAYHVLPMDIETFRLWARFMRGKSNTLYEDAMIAATAAINRLVVVTRNVRDFAHFDVKTLNPFEPNEG